MRSKAQASLEYLMTYGWALIIIATIIGVLIFVVGTPSQQVQFSSDHPNKLLLKSSAADAGKAQAVLQNITGGQIEITDIDETGFTLDSCTLEVSGETAKIVKAGEVMLLECTYTENPQGTVTITYKDFAGLEQIVGITVSGSLGGSTPAAPTETNCSNGVDDDGDGPIDCADSDCLGGADCTCEGGGYQQETICYYEAEIGQSCTARCGTRGCTNDWQDGQNLVNACMHWHPGAGDDEIDTSNTALPFWAESYGGYTNTCVSHKFPAGPSVCDSVTSSGKRICLCNNTPA